MRDRGVPSSVGAYDVTWKTVFASCKQLLRNADVRRKVARAWTAAGRLLPPRRGVFAAWRNRSHRHERQIFWRTYGSLRRAWALQSYAELRRLEVAPVEHPAVPFIKEKSKHDNNRYR